MAQVVFFPLANGTISEKDVRAVARQSADCVIGIDPCLDPGYSIEFCARRAQLGGDSRRNLCQ